MSDLDTYNGTLLLLFLELEERTEDPCEHSQHDVSGKLHAGPGEWLLDVYSSCCGQPQTHILVCDKYKKMMMDSGMCVECARCGAVVSPDEWYRVLGRKGVDF